MAKQIKRKAIGKKQQAILDKYADVIHQLDIIDEMGTREYNRKRSQTVKAQKKVNTLVSKINHQKINIRKLQAEGRSAISELDLVDKMTEDLKDKKLELEESKLDLNTVGSKVWVNGIAYDNVTTDDLDEVDKKILQDLRKDLENYRFKGDMLMTTFYHVYGFTYVSEQTVAIFAKAEGYI